MHGAWTRAGMHLSDFVPGHDQRGIASAFVTLTLVPLKTHNSLLAFRSGQDLFLKKKTGQRIYFTSLQGQLLAPCMTKQKVRISPRGGVTINMMSFLHLT